MEKEDLKEVVNEAKFLELVKKARAGDEEAFMEIVDIFECEMEQLAKYIKMPKEDVMQSLRLGLLELIINKHAEKRIE
ncbi:helix-turn-helix domain-containing protein [Paenibacillus sp. TC-CSREp1]|uniref:helix-turn-helix domain-containing protein n=1 Tax=Paenibacillus sp. TC-CSREp1 TaxID=3410089 RepID=UPI003CFBF945